MQQTIAGVLAEVVEPQNPRGTVVLLHGIGLGAWFWEPWLPTLGEQFRVVALNLHSPGANPGLEDLVATVCGVVDALGPVILLGHSMGALVAQRVATQRTVVALVLLSPLPPGQVRMLPPWAGLRATLALAPDFLAGRPLKMSRQNYQRQGMNLLSEAEIDRWFPRVVPWPNRLVKDLARPPMVETEKVRCPVLVVVGKEDRLVPWEKGRILGDLYEGVVWRYDDMAHSAPLEPGGSRVLRDVLGWMLAPTGPKVLESEGFGPAEGVGHTARRQRRGEEMKKRSSYGQKAGHRS